MQPMPAPLRPVAFALIALAAAGSAYVLGLATGAISVIGYESDSTSQQGAMRTRILPLSLRLPVWLAAGQAVRADYEVDARFGAVTFTVAPPLVLRTSLQAATAYVEGRRSGSVVFTAQAPGWYTVRSDASPLGGPRCGSPSLSPRDLLIGRPDCPIFDVNYSVTWHLAGSAAASTGAMARLAIPPPHGTLVTVRIRD
jgi:hypothetical protein